MEWFTKFPTMDADTLRDLKKTIDEGFRTFTRAYGDGIESIFEPLQHFLIWSERFMTKTPWPIILVLIALVAWFASRNWKIVAGAVGTLLKCHLGGRAIARAEDQRRVGDPGGGNVFAIRLADRRLLCDWTPMERLPASLDL